MNEFLMQNLLLSTLMGTYYPFKVGNLTYDSYSIKSFFGSYLIISGAPVGM